MKTVLDKIPQFALSHWLLRIPLAIVFIQQGLSKFPVTVEEAVEASSKYTICNVSKSALCINVNLQYAPASVFRCL